MDQHDEFRQLEWEVYKTNQEVRTSVVENLGELSVSGIDINMDSLITGISHGRYQKDAALNLASGIDVKDVDVEIELKTAVLSQNNDLVKRLSKKMSF